MTRHIEGGEPPNVADAGVRQVEALGLDRYHDAQLTHVLENHHKLHLVQGPLRGNVHRDLEAEAWL